MVAKLLSSLACGLALALPLPHAAAQAYPEKPVRLVVPFPPGGAADVLARVVAGDLTQTLGQRFIVENRPGASGNIGMDFVARAPADGYTLLWASASIAINNSLIPQTPFDPQKDFTPVSLLAMVPSVMVVPTSLPVATVQELIALSKSKPGTLNYASNGIGTTQHLAGVMLRNATGADLTHVVYKGQDVLVPDLVGGRVHVSFNNLAAVQGFVTKGDLKVLAVALPKRWPGLPDVPTFAEAGVPGFEISSWLALLGPAGMPQAVVEQLNRAVVATVRKPEIIDKILKSGNQPVGGSPAELATFLKAEIGRWSEAVRASGAGKPGAGK